MFLKKFPTIELLQQAYLDAYCRKQGRYDSAAHVLSRELNITVSEIRSILDTCNIPLIGRDVSASKKMAQHRSQYMKAIWEGRDCAWRQARGEKTSKTWGEKPLQKLEAHKARTRAHNNKMAEIARLHPEIKAKRVASATAWMADPIKKSAAFDKSKCTKANWSESERLQVSKNYSDSNKLKWSRLSKEDRLEWVRRCNGRKYWTSINDKPVRFDSSWEEDAYRFFLKMDEPFNFCSNHKTGFMLEDIIWAPDFILPRYNLILDVKGHPKAWEKFNTIHYPKILKCKDTTLAGYCIVLVDKYVMKQLCKYTTVLDLLEDSLWVIPPTLTNNLQLKRQTRLYSVRS